MKMPFTLDAPQSDLAVFSEGAQATRDEMLADYRANKRNSVTFAATTYVHGPNKNHTRLNDAELEKFAASFKGQPFLSDHTREQGSRGGTILDSQLVELDGKKAIRQTVKAVKPWAVEGVLDGTVDRFSIGWNAEQYECTVHGKDFFKCGHSLSDLGEIDEGSGKPVEVLMKGIEGMEVSAVTHPAVPGTGVLETLRQLQESKEMARQAHNDRKDEMKDKVFSLLNLSAETTEADALLALETRLAAPTEKVPAAMLTALELKPEASTDEAIAAIVSLKAPGNYVPKAENDKTMEELATMRADAKVREAKAAGKITPAMEVWAKDFAKSNPDAFAAFVAHAPVQVPKPQQSIVPAGTPSLPKDEITVSPEAKHIYSQLGLTDEEYAAVVKAERA